MQIARGREQAESVEKEERGKRLKGNKGKRGQLTAKASGLTPFSISETLRES